ncbi:MAG: HAD-IA family hydrolase [Spirochaetales bacterium]|nr:HAD-IA family hydrolase [Spirochaetales bacterium]
MVNSKIKGILFDSGRVLNYPASGHWMIGPDFFRYVDKRAFNGISRRRRDGAWQRAGACLRAQPLVRDEEEEYELFLRFYGIFFKELPELSVKEENIKAVTWDLVHNSEKYTFFEEVEEVLTRLKSEYKLALVSDAWPSLGKVYKFAGLKDHFSSIVISSLLGTRKPDKRMYLTALEELGLTPEEVLFVDDNILNLEGAREVGIRETYLLCRSFKAFLYYKFTCTRHRVIGNLATLAS